MTKHLGGYAVCTETNWHFCIWTWYCFS